MPITPPVIVENTDHLRAVFGASAATGRRLAAVTAAWAGPALGPLYWREAEALARAEWPSARIVFAFHCADDAGLAMSALRTGWKNIVLDAHPTVRDKIADIGAQQGAILVEEPVGSTFDLGSQDDPYAALVNWLAQEDDCN